ncbi:MAG: hypothetical protein EOP04_01920 [Proteobacteria bacterium]|nr:MAG: hypothetical protein EOP04_01920 [Pseudomonadota bacterium]
MQSEKLEILVHKWKNNFHLEEKKLDPYSFQYAYDSVLEEDLTECPDLLPTILALFELCSDDQFKSVLAKTILKFTFHKPSYFSLRRNGWSHKEISIITDVDSIDPNAPVPEPYPLPMNREAKLKERLAAYSAEWTNYFAHQEKNDIEFQPMDFPYDTLLDRHLEEFPELLPLILKLFGNSRARGFKGQISPIILDHGPNRLAYDALLAVGWSHYDIACHWKLLEIMTEDEIQLSKQRNQPQ